MTECGISLGQAVGAAEAAEFYLAELYPRLIQFLIHTQHGPLRCRLERPRYPQVCTTDANRCVRRPNKCFPQLHRSLYNFARRADQPPQSVR